ncbi:radical SAM protein [Patescibacteria group bacterium]|nr:radical SAM protein [Patescibacteria group bacterium]
MNKIYYLIYRIGLTFKYGFLWRKPFFLAKAIKNTLLHRLNLKKTFTLRSLCLAITYACNYNCPYCLTREMMKKRGKEEFLKLTDYKRISKEAKKMGAISYAFQGGEIWLRKDFREIIQAFEPKKNYITITTNGTFLNEKEIQKLVDLKIDKILFSLESGLPYEHDKAVHQPGAYDAIMKVINLTLKNKIKVGINLTLSKRNLYSEGFKKLIEFCDQQKILLNIIFGCALGNWKKYRSAMLSEKDIEYYNKNIVPLSPCLNRHLNFNYNGHYGCPAAKEIFYINPWGDVLACPFNHTFFGSLKKDSLRKIHNRVSKIKWFSHFHPRCLVAEEKAFMDDYYPSLGQSQYGYIDYTHWIKKQK